MKPAADDLDRVRTGLIPTDALSAAELAALRAIVFAAFGGERDHPFDATDWEHALGGVHAIAELDGRMLAQAAVVPRSLWVDGRVIQSGYVEAVAVQPEVQRRGLGTAVMRAAAGHIAGVYELGVLSTGDQGFYERLGWRIWRGPASVRRPEGDEPTPDEDGGIMVLETPRTPGWLDLDAPISCEPRAGDDW